MSWHPQAQAPKRQTDVVGQFSDPSGPTFVDEAEVEPEELERHFSEQAREVVEARLVDEWLGIEPAERLPLPTVSGPPRDAEARARADARAWKERSQLQALRRAGLIEGDD